MAWLWRDLRYSLRLLGKTPLATAVAILSLALGIGVNTVVFSLINSLILRSLPIHDPGRLVSIQTINPNNREETRLSLGAFEEIRKRGDLFSGVFVWDGSLLMNLESNGIKYTTQPDLLASARSCMSSVCTGWPSGQNRADRRTRLLCPVKRRPIIGTGPSDRSQADNQHRLTKRGLFSPGE